MLSAVFSALVLVPQGPLPLSAHVNDTTSHGAVGDAALSLNEAVALANGSLTLAQLSPQEAAQIQGTGNVVDRVVVDAAVVPSIILTAPIDAIVGQGGAVRIEGVGRPVVQAGNESHTFEIGTAAINLGGFSIQGGQVAVRGTDFGGTMMMAGMVHHLDLDGQTSSAFDLSVTDGAAGNRIGLMVMHCNFTNMPLAYRLDDRSVQGGLIKVSEFCSYDGVNRGVDLFSGGSSGTSMCWLWRSEFQNGSQVLRVRRDPASTQRQMLRIVHGRYVADGDLTDVEGNAAGETVFHHHHAHFESTTGGKVYWVHPKTARFDVHGSEMTFVGDVDISANLVTQRIWHHNNVFRNSTITLDNDGSAPDLEWNYYDNCVLNVPSTARTGLAVKSSELHNTDVSAQSFLASVTLQNTYRVGGQLSGSVAEVAPAPSRWIGFADVSPADPQVGGTVTFSTDLPPGMAVIWDIAPSVSRPTTTAYPYRFYGDLGSAIALPGLFILQSSLQIRVPNVPSFVGIESYVQPVAIPIFGQAHVPPIHLIRGGLVTPRM